MRQRPGDGRRGVGERMAKIHVKYESGEPDRTIEFTPGGAPFSHDGEPGSILDVMLGHKVPLEHACGGKCACTTCHVIVKEGEQHLSEMRDDEMDRLDTAPGLTLHSRLGCQAVVKDPDAEVTIVVPKFHVNS